MKALQKKNSVSPKQIHLQIIYIFIVSTPDLRHNRCIIHQKRCELRKVVSYETLQRP